MANCCQIAVCLGIGEPLVVPKEHPPFRTPPPPSQGGWGIDHHNSIHSLLDILLGYTALSTGTPGIGGNPRSPTAHSIYWGRKGEDDVLICIAGLPHLHSRPLDPAWALYAPSLGYHILFATRSMIHARTPPALADRN